VNRRGYMLSKLLDFLKGYSDYKDSLDALVSYLPSGDLDTLLRWGKKWIPYRHDIDKDGKYDPLQNYNGADLTIKAKGGDCESIAAVHSEVIRRWPKWESWHVCMVFTRDCGDTYEAHDVAVFKDPTYGQGWIDGQIFYGDYEAMYGFYKGEGWAIVGWWEVNDLGERIRQI
jgi:hypothetical protein